MEGERRLSADHPALDATFDGANWVGTDGWEVLDAAATRFVHETSIDLSGYSRERLTFFTQSIGLQDPGIYVFQPPAASTYNAVQVLDIVTSVPLDANRVANLAAQGVSPGMIGSTVNFETLIFGMYRFFTSNTNIPYPAYQQLERSQRFDSGEPSASDRLYCYRIVSLFASGPFDPTTYVKIPAARQLIGGAFGAETELVYMQRLKRSYELKQ